MNDLAGLVEEAVTIHASAEAVWALLTCGRLSRSWWGELDHDLDGLAVEAQVRTGQSSLYRLWVERYEEPAVLELLSSELGVAGPTRVRFDLRPAADGVRVCLTEQVADTAPAVVHLVAELWHERLARLRAVATGEVPSEPNEVRLTRSLPDPAWRPLHKRNVLSWMPISEAPDHSRQFFVVDSQGARPFPVLRWTAHYDERLHLTIAVGHPATVTWADLEVVADERLSGLALSVTHRGWLGTTPDLQTRQILRSRFRATWREALDRAARGGQG